MMRYDTLVQAGTLCTHDHLFAGDLAITQGKIAAIARPGDLRASDASTIIDARGCYVMPGLVGMHDTGERDEDDAEAAPQVFRRGVLTSLEVLTPTPTQTLREAFLAEESRRRQRALVLPGIDVGWHLAITRREHVGEIGALADLGVTSFVLREDVLRAPWGDEIATAALQHRVTLVVHATLSGSSSGATSRAAEVQDRFIRSGAYVVALPSSDDSSFCLFAKRGTKTEIDAMVQEESGTESVWSGLARRASSSPVGLTWKHATAPAMHLGLWGRKGGLLPGFDADVLAVDAAEFTIRHALLRGQPIPREVTKEHPAPAGIWLHRARVG